jgi:hypothetical protein
MSRSSWRLGPVAAVPAGDDVILSAGHAAGCVSVVVPQAVSELLARCDSFAPIEAHARARRAEWLMDERARRGRLGAVTWALANAGHAAATVLRLREPQAGNPWLLDGLLEHLAKQGFLISDADVLGRLREGRVNASDPIPITTLAIPTADRPQLIARCLDSYLENLTPHGSLPRVLVCDGSTDPSRSEAASSVVHATSRRFGVDGSCVSRADRLAFARNVARLLAVPAGDVAFAFMGDEYVPAGAGAERNTILVATLGERVLSVDDDTLGHLAPSPMASSGWCLDSSHDPRQWEFFHARNEALKVESVASRSISELHARFLGTRLANIRADLGTDPQLQTANADLLQDVLERRGTVMVTMPGIRGHSGVKWPTRALDADGPWCSSLWRSRELFVDGLSTQSARAAVPGITISNTSYLASTVFAFDNTQMMPPFLPVLRSHDVLFGRLMRRCHEGAHVLHLPWTLPHDPSDPRALRVEEIAAHTGMELAYVLGDLLQQVPLGRYLSPQERTMRLGAALLAFAGQPQAAIEDAVRAIYLSRQADRIAGLERSLSTGNVYPSYWVDVARWHLGALRGAVVDPHAMMPMDIPGPIGTRVDMMTRILRRFGRLLELWPDVLEAARDLNARGRGLTAVG